jgi:nitrogen-specific signal transduction histidine kinase
VSLTKEKKSILLAFEDNGKGIPKDLHDRIFEPTFTTKTSGMGLGLGMVKSIVETYEVPSFLILILMHLRVLNFASQALIRN